jgi:hypothetical protein
MAMPKMYQLRMAAWMLGHIIHSPKNLAAHRKSGNAKILELFLDALIDAKRGLTQIKRGQRSKMASKCACQEQLITTGKLLVPATSPRRRKHNASHGARLESDLRGDLFQSDQARKGAHFLLLVLAQLKQ